MTGISNKINSDLKTKKLDNPEKKKALIVDDETDICYLLSHILRQKDIQTVFAGSLAEADRMLQSPNFFYYVFLDNHLPDGLGINQIKRWKEKFPAIHFIMISAHDSFEEKRKAKSDGADTFISKPFSKEVILNSIVPTSA
ncbi:MAG TPA: response regulator [Chitinophagaceae bacterium]|jgi:DNA-binding NtrC family response regulator|nr:response regulator [Chitinophagaceae bacterium]